MEPEDIATTIKTYVSNNTTSKNIQFNPSQYITTTGTVTLTVPQSTSVHGGLTSISNAIIGIIENVEPSQREKVLEKLLSAYFTDAVNRTLKKIEEYDIGLRPSLLRGLQMVAEELTKEA